MKWQWTLITMTLLASLFEVRGQTAEEAPDPGKDEGFKDLITDNQLDERQFIHSFIHSFISFFSLTIGSLSRSLK